jgi:DNA-binding response OmpR family regulator
MPLPILLCVGNSSSIRRLRRLFSEESEFEVISADNESQAFAVANTNLTINAAVFDDELPGPPARELAARMKLVRPQMLVVLLSGCVSVAQDAIHFLDAAASRFMGYRSEQFGTDIVGCTVHHLEVR